jgi:hypothetical protein
MALILLNAPGIPFEFYRIFGRPGALLCCLHACVTLPKVYVWLLTILHFLQISHLSHGSPITCSLKMQAARLKSYLPNHMYIQKYRYVVDCVLFFCCSTSITLARPTLLLGVQVSYDTPHQVHLSLHSLTHTFKAPFPPFVQTLYKRVLLPSHRGCGLVHMFRRPLGSKDYLHSHL